jgi:hypothetical protein
VMAPAHEPRHEVADGERREDFARGGEVPLDPDEHHGVVLARVLPCDIVEPRGAHCLRRAAMS